MNHRFALMTFLACLSICISMVPAATVYWQSSTNSAPWVDKGTLTTTAWDNDNTSYVSVNEQTMYQEYDGHGGSFNEMGWKSILALAQKDRDSLMKMLFDSVAGCNFNICRMPLGMSDYSLTQYTLSETSGDYAMNNFSIAHDRQYLIPFVNAAMAARPSLKVWGSPWTPPLWMKAGDGTLKQDAQTLTAYALYFAKAVKAYQQEGLRYYAVHPQNEPMWGSYGNTNWLCRWNGQQLRDFIKNYLGPRFRNDDINAQIWLGTINCDYTCEISGYDPIPPVVFPDTVANSYCTGLGIQYTPESANWCRTNYPYKRIMQTETPCGTMPGVFWSYAMGNDDVMRDYYNKGASAYMQWNMVLDTTGLSLGNWRQFSMVQIDSGARKVIYTPQFYQVRHYKYIKAGAYRIATTGNWNTAIAFRNLDGENVLILTNKNSSNATIAINFNGQKIKPTVPGYSFNTFRIAGTPIPAISPFSRMEAEKYQIQSGTYAIPCSEGGSCLSYIHNNDWAVYNNLDFGIGAGTFSARVAGTVGGTIEVRVDSLTGTVTGTCTVAPTGGATTWSTASCDVTGLSGRHTIYLKFKGTGTGNLFNLNWLMFNSGVGIQTSAGAMDARVQTLNVSTDAQMKQILRLDFARPRGRDAV